MIVYKFTVLNGEAPWGYGKIDLPKKERPGAWRTVEGTPKVCIWGLHGYPSAAALIAEGLHTNTLWVAELGGEIDHGKHKNRKVCGTRCRLLHRVTTWNQRIRQLWLADCAEHVLYIYENYEKRFNSKRDTNLLQETINRIRANGKVVDTLRVRRLVWRSISGGNVADCVCSAIYGNARGSLSALNAAMGHGGQEAYNQELEWQATRLHEYLTGQRGEPKP